MLQLITDRTQADVKRAKELNEKVYAAFASTAAVVTADTDVLIEPTEIIQSTLTAEEFAEWKSGLKGAYNYTDLNRVESAVKEIANYWVYGLATKTDWKMSDELTQAEMQRFLTNLRAIKEKLGSDISIPANMSFFTYQSANNIEKMLLDAYEYRDTHTVGLLSIGDSLWLNVSGEKKEFIVVHQGNPDSSVYEDGRTGTWLLMKDIYTKKQWRDRNTIYSESTVADYLESTFSRLLDTNLPIKYAKFPVLGSDGTVVSDYGSVFLLSGTELGHSSTAIAEEGAVLDYFEDPRVSHKAYYNGVATEWWTRSKEKGGTGVLAFGKGGGAGLDTGTEQAGVRPALILNSNAVFATLDGKNYID